MIENNNLNFSFSVGHHCPNNYLKKHSILCSIRYGKELTLCFIKVYSCIKMNSFPTNSNPTSV